MDRWIRRVVERLFWDKISVSNATSNDQVNEVIRRLQPVGVIGGLRRFGPPGDGGYLMPDDLDGIAACVSPGVSFESGFDEVIANRGIDVILADASVNAPPVHHSRFRFLPKFVDVTASPRALTLDELCREAKIDGDLILQMDIEGAEYRVLCSASDELLQRFRIIIVEFHELDQLFSRFSFGIISAAFTKLTMHHAVVHIHPNNVSKPVTRGALSVPPVMEFTFYRKDRMAGRTERRPTFPHPLDAACVASCPSYPLPACWWPDGWRAHGGGRH